MGTCVSQRRAKWFTIVRILGTANGWTEGESKIFLNHFQGITKGQSRQFILDYLKAHFSSRTKCIDENECQKRKIYVIDTTGNHLINLWQIHLTTDAHSEEIMQSYMHHVGLNRDLLTKLSHVLNGPRWAAQQNLGESMGYVQEESVRKLEMQFSAYDSLETGLPDEC